MRRFERGSGKALFWPAASLAVWWCGSTAAFAQNADVYFDFTFYGCSCNGVTSSGVFEFNFDPVNPGNTTLIGMSGSVSGFTNPLDNGSIESLLGAPLPSSGSQIPFTLSDGTNETIILSSQSPYADLTTSNGEDAFGSIFLTPAAATPAPIPGAGLLSYLFLGFAGLLGTARRWSRTFSGMFGGKAWRAR